MQRRRVCSDHGNGETARCHSRFDIGAWVEGKIADKFGRSEGSACVTGDGIARPRGFMDADTDSASDATRTWGKLQYVVSGSASTAADPDGGANGIRIRIGLYVPRTVRTACGL